MTIEDTVDAAKEKYDGLLHRLADDMTTNGAETMLDRGQVVETPDGEQWQIGRRVDIDTYDCLNRRTMLPRIMHRKDFALPGEARDDPTHSAEWYEGGVACDMDTEFCDNPYSKGTAQQADWCQGWNFRRGKELDQEYQETGIHSNGAETMALHGYNPETHVAIPIKDLEAATMETEPAWVFGTRVLIMEELRDYVKRLAAVEAKLAEIQGRLDRQAERIALVLDGGGATDVPGENLSQLRDSLRESIRDVDRGVSDVVRKAGG